MAGKTYVDALLEAITAMETAKLYVKEPQTGHGTADEILVEFLTNIPGADRLRAAYVDLIRGS